MYWVGVPVILTSDQYHQYLERESYLKDWYFNETDEIYCIEMETHRRAFHNRINFVELNQNHDGSQKFPYKVGDMMFYLKDLIDQHRREGDYAVQVEHIQPEPNLEHIKIDVRAADVSNYLDLEKESDDGSVSNSQSQLRG